MCHWSAAACRTWFCTAARWTGVQPRMSLASSSAGPLRASRTSTTPTWPRITAWCSGVRLSPSRAVGSAPCRANQMRGRSGCPLPVWIVVRHKSSTWCARAGVHEATPVPHLVQQRRQLCLIATLRGTVQGRGACRGRVKHCWRPPPPAAARRRSAEAPPPAGLHCQQGRRRWSRRQARPWWCAGSTRQQATAKVGQPGRMRPSTGGSCKQESPNSVQSTNGGPERQRGAPSWAGKPESEAACVAGAAAENKRHSIQEG